MVPVFTQTPPSIRPRSMTATDLPSFAAAMAAFCPPGPEPMTTRSYSSMEPMAKGVRRLRRSRMPTGVNTGVNNSLTRTWRASHAWPGMADETMTAMVGTAVAERAPCCALR